MSFSRDNLRASCTLYRTQAQYAAVNAAVAAQVIAWTACSLQVPGQHRSEMRLPCPSASGYTNNIVKYSDSTIRIVGIPQFSQLEIGRLAGSWKTSGGMTATDAQPAANRLYYAYLPPQQFRRWFVLTKPPQTQTPTNLIQRVHHHLSTRMHFISALLFR